MEIYNLVQMTLLDASIKQLLSVNGNESANQKRYAALLLNIVICSVVISGNKTTLIAKERYELKDVDREVAAL